MDHVTLTMPFKGDSSSVGSVCWDLI